MRRSFLITTLLLLALLAVWSPTLAQSKLADWTYMQYYNADNNLETSLYGDLTEMQEVGSTAQVNIVAEVDRAPGYETGFGDWTDTRRFLLKHEPQPVLTHDQKLDEILAYAYAQSGQDYHTLIPQAAQLRQSNPNEYRQKLTDIGVKPDNDTQIDQIIHGHEIGLEFNTQPVQDMGELDMGDPQTLADFVIWAVQNYPAKHYALTISTHGGGWLGNGPDETNHDDMLTLPDLTSALQQIQAKTGLDQLDLIGFDACLMGQLEVYRALVPYAHYVLASEEEIPGDGWEYTTPFQELTQNPTMSAKAFGQDIVDAYMKYYAGPGSRTQVDLGLVDESKIQPVVDALKDFTASADQNTLDKLSELGIARLNAQRFASATSDAIMSTTNADVFSSIDLISFMNLVAKQPDVEDDLKAAAQKVITVTQDAILQSSADDDLPDAHGMAIYFPTNSKIAQLPANGGIDPVPYASANPNMSAWNTFLNTFHTTIDKALLPGNLKISVEKILPEKGDASIYDPPVVIFDTDGQGVASLQFVAVLNKPDGTSTLIDTAPLAFQSVLTDGTLINEMPSGQSLGDDFAWNVEQLLVSDDSSQIQSVLFTPDPGLARAVVTGTYVAQDGTKQSANLIFSTDTQQVLATYGTDDNGQVSELETAPGDQFYPDQYRWTDNGPEPQPAKTALVYGIQPFTYQYVPADSGDYGIGMQITDLAGNSVFDARHVAVNNQGLDPNWRGFKDVERGVNFLYPWNWADPSVLADQSGQPDELEINDPNGDIRIFVAKRDEDIDTAAQEMYDIEAAQTDAQVDQPTAFKGDMKQAQWITYSYTGDQGEARDGAVIIMRVDSNNATYTFDVDAPDAQINQAQTILDKMVNSLTFFTPFVPPDSTTDSSKSPSA
ncbi:MAG TPA: clostripain-related cysteine peptidase [Phototrophicaceae bacterium]|nr:clostripain-related cysteine peptidase [Phototrophicaceae bacterium]